MEIRLKALRKLRGYKSAKEFADFIGMQEKTYRNYEQGARGINLETACRLCDALGCSLDELAGRNKENPFESEIINILRTITPDGQKQLMIYARGIAATYSKNLAVEKTA